MPGLTKLKRGSATRPFPGILADILNDKGESISVGGGLLAIRSPWPAMLGGIYGDPERYVKQYWSRWPETIYFPGDGAKQDSEGYFWILGRVDDVLNVAGHRTGTMEVESALVDFHGVPEAVVVGKNHEIKGQAIARPDDVIFAADLLRTRSGKIVRRLLRDIAEGKAAGDTTTLADPMVVQKLKEQYSEEAG